jgi:hypothetical protein
MLFSPQPILALLKDNDPSNNLGCILSAILFVILGIIGTLWEKQQKRAKDAKLKSLQGVKQGEEKEGVLIVEVMWIDRDGWPDTRTIHKCGTCGEKASSSMSPYASTNERLFSVGGRCPHCGTRFTKMNRTELNKPGKIS